MKTVLHKADERGFANHGWLMASHSFSFANYFNPERMNFGKLRVLNDDIIALSMGFATHPHQNMEIITIPLSGVLKHRDNMAEDWQQVLPNEVQVMSAGTGVYHSEMNASTSERLALFQIWIEPSLMNVSPRYDQKTFLESERKDKLQVLVTSFSSEEKNTLKIHQDAKISRISLSESNEFSYELLSQNHGVYIMNIEGEVECDNVTLHSRDALGISETNSFTLTSKSSSEILFIEVPMQ